MRLRDQGIDNDDGGVGRVRRARGLSNDDGGVENGRGIYDVSKVLETTTGQRGLDKSPEESTTTTEASGE